MNIEARLGIQGFSEAQEKLENLSTQKAFLDETNRNTLYEMSCMSKELHDKIALKKLHLEPLIKGEINCPISRQTIFSANIVVKYSFLFPQSSSRND